MHVTYWLHTTIPAGKVYGRSPGMDALPAIRAYNQRVLAKAIEWEWARVFLGLFLR